MRSPTRAPHSAVGSASMAVGDNKLLPTYLKNALNCGSSNNLVTNQGHMPKPTAPSLIQAILTVFSALFLFTLMYRGSTTGFSATTQSAMCSSSDSSFEPAHLGTQISFQQSKNLLDIRDGAQNTLHLLRKHSSGDSAPWISLGAQITLKPPI